MTDHHEGSCLCGTVRFVLEGTWGGFFLCHCTRCQKESGSAHGATLFSPDATLSWLSGEEAVKHFTVKDSLHGRSFCGTCGSPLPHYNAGINQWQIPAGCLDTPVGKTPDAHIFTRSRADWDEKLDALPNFPKLPG